ncbi:MAG: diacylglycerol kinase family protein [Kineosporiaceae bacterium]
MTTALPENLAENLPAAARRDGAVAIVVNPTKLDDEVSRREQVTAELAARGLPAPLWLETSERDPGFGMTQQALDRGVGVVIAWGGDGTVRAVLSVLAGSGVPMAVLPAGTGNLLARNLDLPLDDLPAAIAVALDGRDRSLDIGRIEPPDADGRIQRFAIMAGVGLDAAVMRDVPATVKAKVGWLAYVMSALGHLRQRRFRARLALDDTEVMNALVQSIVIGNMGRLQGGIELLPDAVPDDGSLDVAVLAARGPLDWLRILGRVVTRRADLDQRYLTFRGERVTVSVRGLQPRQADGDVLDQGHRLDVRIEPRAILVRVPAETPR